MLLDVPTQLLNRARKKKKFKTKKSKKKKNFPVELLIMKKRPVLSKFKGAHHSFAEITTVSEPPLSAAISKLLWGSWKV